MVDMKELIARLEAADVGGQELNGLIFRMLADDPSGKDHWFMSCGELMTEDNADSVTTSLDAALALAERVLPEMGPISLCIAGSAVVSVDALDPCAPSLAGNIYGRTPALALCIAILKAKAQGEGG